MGIDAISSALKGLSWYQGFAIVGLFGMVVGFTQKIEWATNEQIVLFSSAIALMGFGRWSMRQPYAMYSYPFMVTGFQRKLSPFGCGIMLLGLVVLAYFFMRVTNYIPPLSVSIATPAATSQVIVVTATP